MFKQDQSAKGAFKLVRSPRFFGKSETVASASQLTDELNRVAIKVEETTVINAWDVSPVVPKGTRGTCAL